jgi:multimeric flavodoxin WrbA
VKVLIINASPRRHGVTSALLAELQKLIGDTHEVQVVRVHDLVMRPCQGCLKCRPDKPCIMPRDDAHLLAEAIQAADLLVLGSPVYWGNMPGPLKIFFDRNVPLFEYCEARSWFRPRPRLKGKRAILIVNGGAPFPYNLLPSQSRGTIRSLKTVLNAGGIKIVSVLNVPDSFSFDKKILPERYLQRVKRMADSIAAW